MNFSQRAISAFIVLIPLTASADDPKITIECRKPSVSATFEPTGTGEGRSPTLQFNINVAGAISVNKNSPGNCTATIGRGYRITSGRAVISQTNVYTDYNYQSSSRPAVTEILKHVTVTLGQPQTDSIDFTVSSNTEEYTGTVNMETQPIN